MPGGRIHRKHSEELYGYGFEEIHSWMDGTFLSKGPNHHQEDRHDPRKTPERAFEIFKDKVPKEYVKYIKDAVKDHIELDKKERRKGPPLTGKATNLPEMFGKEEEDLGLKRVKRDPEGRCKTCNSPLREKIEYLKFKKGWNFAEIAGWVERQSGEEKITPQAIGRHFRKHVKLVPASMKEIETNQKTKRIFEGIRKACEINGVKHISIDSLDDEIEVEMILEKMNF